MKDFICDLLRGVSMIGSIVGFILIASNTIEKFYAFMIFFGFMFLYFLAEGLNDDNTKAKNKEQGLKLAKDKKPAQESTAEAWHHYRTALEIYNNLPWWKKRRKNAPKPPKAKEQEL